MQSLKKAVTSYLKNDKLLLWKLNNNLFWLHYERFEYSRLNDTRALMYQHKSFQKEKILEDEETDENG